MLLTNLHKNMSYLQFNNCNNTINSNIFIIINIKYFNIMKNYRIIDTDTRMTNPTYVEVRSVSSGVHVHLRCDFETKSERFFVGKKITETKRGWTVITSLLDSKNHKLFYPRGRYVKVCF